MPLVAYKYELRVAVRLMLRYVQSRNKILRDKIAEQIVRLDIIDTKINEISTNRETDIANNISQDEAITQLSIDNQYVNKSVQTVEDLIISLVDRINSLESLFS